MNISIYVIRFNNAPVSAMNPVVRVPVGQVHIINIPMADVDGDSLRCRWGTSENETGGIFKPKGSLQANPCQLTYNATRIGYESIALIIEDYDTNNQILSWIPLQFLIQIFAEVTTTTRPPNTNINETSTPRPNVISTCYKPPEYKGDWTPGACIGIASNKTIRIRVVFQVPCVNSSTVLKDILTITPSGMTRGPIIRDTYDSDTYFMYLEWMPSSTQYGIHQMCVTPIDNSSRSGQTTCFALLVDTQSPQFIHTSASPVGIVAENQSVWTINTDIDMIPPTDPSITIKFFKQRTTINLTDVEVLRIIALTAIYQPRKITFHTGNTTWEKVRDFIIDMRKLLLDRDLIHRTLNMVDIVDNIKISVRLLHSISVANHRSNTALYTFVHIHNIFTSRVNDTTYYSTVALLHSINHVVFNRHQSSIHSFGHSLFQ
jgi:hypothetical protein